MPKPPRHATDDLQRLLAGQQFGSIEDVQAFMNNLVGKPLPSLPPEALSDEEQAQDLVSEAYGMPRAKARRNLEQALELDVNCIDAYACLGEMEASPAIAIAFFERGVALGRAQFGGAYLAENKGSFWGLYETRPFMNCLAHYAECLYLLGKLGECVAVYEEMLELNPNDNQGVRDLLMLYLVQQGDPKKYRKYAKQYESDGMAFTQFNRALFAFKTQGPSEEAINALKAAMFANRFVAAKLLAKQPCEAPDAYGLGDQREASYYAHYAHPVWQATDGAISWLKQHASKP